MQDRPTEQPASEPPPRPISRWPVIILVGGLGLAVALVIIGATLAGTPAAAPQISGPGTVDSPRAVSIILRDYRFDPTPLYLVPGEVVSLSVVNGGLVEHELVLGDATYQAAWRAADAAATPPAPFATAPPASIDPGLTGLRLVLPSGASTVVDYKVPGSGSLELICHLPGHAERGMVGDIVLRSDY